MLQPDADKVERKAKVLALFLSPGHPIGIDAYRREHPQVAVPSNEEILDTIRADCPDVKIHGGAESVGIERAVAEVERGRGDLDGLLVFGSPCCVPVVDDLVSFGLPTILVGRMLEYCTPAPFGPEKTRNVVTCHLPAHYDKDRALWARRLRAIEESVGLVAALADLKRMRVLVVTDKPPLGYFEPMDLQCVKGRKQYDLAYLGNLTETFGTELVNVPQKTLIEDRVSAQDTETARRIADRWIDEATGVRGTNRDEIVRTAKLYLAMKDLMEEHDCGAVTVEDFGWPPLGYDASASAGMAISQFCTDGVVATSETLTDCLITQQLGLSITGSTGMLGDYTIDPVGGIAVVAHCEGPINPYGDGRRSPFTIRNLPFSEENEGGAGIQVHYPIGEKVTVVKIGIYQKKLAVFSGTTVSGEERFAYWDDILGRNKVAIATDARALFDNVDWKAFGHHRVVFFGDHRRRFTDLARLIGFEVVEEDRSR